MSLIILISTGTDIDILKTKYNIIYRMIVTLYNYNNNKNNNIIIL